MNISGIKQYSLYCANKSNIFFGATKQEVKKILIDNNFVPKNELYQRNVTDKEREAIIAFYDPNLLKNSDFQSTIRELYCIYKDKDTLAEEFSSFYITDLLQQPLDDKDISLIQKFSDIVGDDVFKKNFPTFFIVYKILSEQGVFESILEQAQNQDGIAKLLSNAIKNPPDNETLDVLREYKSLGGFAINNTLRRFYNIVEIDWGKSDEEYLDKAFKIMDYLYQFSLNSDITIYRGDSISILNEFKDKNGNKLADKFSSDEMNNFEIICRELSSGEYAIPYMPGFLSGCAEEKTYQNKIKRQVNWKLHVPKGIRAIYIDAFNINKKNPNENEILLENGLAIKIKNAKYDLSSKKIYIEADVLDILITDSENKQ